MFQTFIFPQFFPSIEEMEWAIEVMKEVGVPIACTMRMGPTGDKENISPGDCAVRMAQAGITLERSLERQWCSLPIYHMLSTVLF